MTAYPRNANYARVMGSGSPLLSGGAMDLPLIRKLAAAFVGAFCASLFTTAALEDAT